MTKVNSWRCRTFQSSVVVSVCLDAVRDVGTHSFSYSLAIALSLSQAHQRFRNVASQRIRNRGEIGHIAQTETINRYFYVRTQNLGQSSSYMYVLIAHKARLLTDMVGDDNTRHTTTTSTHSTTTATSHWHQQTKQDRGSDVGTYVTNTTKRGRA